MKEQLTIVKIGGAILEDPEKLDTSLKQFLKVPGKKILVHGGGRRASELEKSFGLNTQMIEGRRITSAASLEVVVMTYAGLLNKEVVAKLNSLGMKAGGISGIDGQMIVSKKRLPVDGIDYGYVGDPILFNPDIIDSLLNAEIIPVIAPLTSNDQGQILNTNADTIASFLAIEMSNSFNTNLIYCFEIEGVLTEIDDRNSLVNEIDELTFKKLLEEKKLSGGIIPKISNALNTVKNGVGIIKIMSYTQLSEFKTDVGTRIY